MRFRRKDRPAAEEASPEGRVDAPSGDSPDPEPPPGGGPFDADEVDLDPDDPTRLDLGGMVVRGREGVEIRLNVDEASGTVNAVLLVTREGAAEIRVFAAPRSEDIWPDVRRQIAADAARRGGTVTEVDGPFGPALDVVLTGRTQDGQTVVQQSRVVGIAGPRWLMRVNLLGRPATDFSDDGVLEQALREVVVVRGSGPMAPGDPIPLVVPPGAQPMSPPT